MTNVSPITAADLPDVGRFLHENLNGGILPEAWVAALSHRWAEFQPNHGMQLRCDDRLVGVFCAIYSDQWIDGRLERFCNPHSWCVLNEHRSRSISLILPLLKQTGYHFTMYTPNAKVAEVFRGLKFRNLENGLLYFPNLPSLRRNPGDFSECRPDFIAKRLTDRLLRDYESHRNIPWLRFLAFGSGSDSNLLIYKRDSAKRLPCARIIHVSARTAFSRHGHIIRTHLLMSAGLPISRIESRFLDSPPSIAVQRVRDQPKLVLSKTLRDGDFVDIYSELAALDV